jgi:hypothetical protein
LSYSCATLRYLVDSDRDVTVPVGVILWNTETSWWDMRFPTEGERVPQVPAQSSTYLRLVKSQLTNWIESNRLPYSEPKEKLSAEWWLSLKL